MRIAVIGACGMLGQDIVKVLNKYSILGLFDKNEPSANLDSSKYTYLNIVDEKKVLISMLSFRPDVIINCAAYTQVDAAEENKDEALDVNYYGTKNLAKAAKLLNAYMIHISSDYVFSGEGPVFEYNLPKNPLNFYGYTKLLSEKALEGVSCTIIRTSWLYGVSGSNFPYTVARALLAGRDVSVVNDQFGKPTFSEDLALKIKFLILNMKERKRIIHFTNNVLEHTGISWYGFALRIKDFLPCNLQTGKIGKVIPISTESLKQKAKRPKHALLCSNSINEAPSWDDSLQQFMTEAYF